MVLLCAYIKKSHTHNRIVHRTKKNSLLVVSCISFSQMDESSRVELKSEWSEVRNTKLRNNDV